MAADLDARQGADAVFDYLAELDLGSEVGASRTYSDLGFMLLRAIVESVIGQPFDAHVRAAVHEPLGMADIRFLPGADDGPFAATSHGNPYEYGMVAHEWPYEILGDVDPDDFDGCRDYTLVGEVNDGNTWYGWEGVSGHAGLFATARDLARFGQTMVNGGGYGDHTFVSPETVATFLETPYDGVQAHGFLTGRLGDGTGYGHNGFTGTEFAFDPDRELVVVLLTNRQHQGHSAPWDIHPSNLDLLGLEPGPPARRGRGAGRVAGRRVPSPPPAPAGGAGGPSPRLPPSRSVDSAHITSLGRYGSAER